MAATVIAVAHLAVLERITIETGRALTVVAAGQVLAYGIESAGGLINGPNLAFINVTTPEYTGVFSVNFFKTFTTRTYKAAIGIFAVRVDATVSNDVITFVYILAGNVTIVVDKIKPRITKTFVCFAY